MSTDNSTIDALKKLVEVDNRILVDEIRDHVLYARVLLATGIGLLLFGVVLSLYYPPLGLLLVLVGLLRTINIVYAFKRGDSSLLALRTWTLDVTRTRIILGI